MASGETSDPVLTAGILPDVTFATNRDAERAVLGTLLIYRKPEYVKKCSKLGLTPNDFYWSNLGAIFAAMSTVARLEEEVDYVTVTEELRKSDDPHVRAISPAEVDELAAYAPSAGNLSAYVRRVKELSRWRARIATLRDVIGAVSRLSNESWEELVPFLATPSTSKATPPNGPALRLVVNGETGEVLESRHNCPSCANLRVELQDAKDLVKGAESDRKKWVKKYHDLRRDEEKRAMEDPLWPIAAGLFNIWRRATGHVRSDWTFDRYLACERLLRKYGHVTFERAIAGIAYDPWESEQKNGRIEKHDGWDTLCKSADRFERYCNKAPKGWKPTLIVGSKENVDGSNQPRLMAVKDQ